MRISVLNRVTVPWDASFRKDDVIDVSAAVGPTPWLAKKSNPPSADRQVVFPASGNSSSTPWSLGFCQPSIMVTVCAALMRLESALVSQLRAQDSGMVRHHRIRMGLTPVVRTALSVTRFASQLETSRSCGILNSLCRTESSCRTFTSGFFPTAAKAHAQDLGETCFQSRES